MNKTHNKKQSRRYIFFLLMLILVRLTAFETSAHSGKTDENGGHVNSATGDYHYHHGYPAHKHPGGICPYDYDDKTNHNSGDSANSSGDTISWNNLTNSSNKSEAIYIEGVATWILIVSSIIALIAYFLGKWLGNTIDGKKQAKIANFIFCFAIVAIIVAVAIFVFT